MQNILKTMITSVRNDETNIYIQWKDGAECALNLLALRKNCPCVTCRGGHQPEDIRQTGHITEISLVSWEKTGRYGLRFTWSDRHNDGIYTLDGLRYACDNDGIYPLS
jgi:DUF971 family protein